jgi:hypothetical protein
LQKSGAFPASVRPKEDSENIEKEREERKSWRDEGKKRKAERKGRNGFQSQIRHFLQLQ